MLSYTLLRLCLTFAMRAHLTPAALQGPENDLKTTMSLKPKHPSTPSRQDRTPRNSITVTLNSAAATMLVGKYERVSAPFCHHNAISYLPGATLSIVRSSQPCIMSKAKRSTQHSAASSRRAL